MESGVQGTSNVAGVEMNSDLVGFKLETIGGVIREDCPSRLRIKLALRTSNV